MLPASLRMIVILSACILLFFDIFRFFFDVRWGEVVPMYWSPVDRDLGAVLIANSFEFQVTAPWIINH